MNTQLVVRRLKATPGEILDDVVLGGGVPRVGDRPRGPRPQRLAHEVEEAPALEADADEGDEGHEVLQGEPVVAAEPGGRRREGLLPEAAAAAAESEGTSRGGHGGDKGGEKGKGKRR